MLTSVGPKLACKYLKTLILILFKLVIWSVLVSASSSNIKHKGQHLNNLLDRSYIANHQLF